MESRSRARTALLIFLMLCWCASTVLRPAPSGAWQVRLEVAQVRLSFGTRLAPVRERTVLFDFGQVRGALGWQ